MSETFTFTRPVYAFGRNGWMNQRGISLTLMPTFSVLIEPLNRRGVGRCSVSVPAEDLDRLIAALTALRDEGRKKGAGPV